jgi:cyclic lactone autoinducer peptide
MKKIYLLLAVVVSLIAIAGTTFGCQGYGYQPRTRE